jgi:hypothetical protein
MRNEIEKTYDTRFENEMNNDMMKVENKSNDARKWTRN